MLTECTIQTAPPAAPAWWQAGDSGDALCLDGSHYAQALLIRQVEETFLELFAKGKLNGTVHTCVGQEFSAVAFAGQLERSDFIFSNHRCHGHYIAFTGDYRGLIAELMGKASGTCGGIGSSQHLCRNNFYSNGIQGGIVPVAAGMALANKLKGNRRIGIVFIGDGTLGQGVVYETLNIISKWQIPLLVVCENNMYAQSTPQSASLAGDIRRRAEAFGLRTEESDTWHPGDLYTAARGSIDYVREGCRPAFHLVNTYRLNAHSKGDDERAPEEVSEYRRIDPLEIFRKEHPEAFAAMEADIRADVACAVESIEQENELPPERYYKERVPDNTAVQFVPLEEMEHRQVALINDFFDGRMGENGNLILLGEDIADPYGGAFKVTRGLSGKYPAQVFTCPISEAAIAGIANGLALAGMHPFVEIMFGDFITLCMDQIINHASKFHHMYNGQVNCPVVIRTPMGGGRGYGPTHSQTLDKFLLGIDNVSVVALNAWVDPAVVYDTVYRYENHPVVVIENKTDYWKMIGADRFPNYVYERSDGRYPVVRARPRVSEPTATFVTYGGAAHTVLGALQSLIVDMDLKPEVFIPTCIHPVDGMSWIVESVRRTGKLFVVEEGSIAAGFGSEVIAAVAERLDDRFIARRVGAAPVPIPSPKSLEKSVLVNTESLLKQVEEAVS